MLLPPHLVFMRTRQGYLVVGMSAMDFLMDLTWALPTCAARSWDLTGSANLCKMQLQLSEYSCGYDWYELDDGNYIAGLLIRH